MHDLQMLRTVWLVGPTQRSGGDASRFFRSSLQRHPNHSDLNLTFHFKEILMFPMLAGVASTLFRSVLGGGLESVAKGAGNAVTGASIGGTIGNSKEIAGQIASALGSAGRMTALEETAMRNAEARVVKDEIMATIQDAAAGAATMQKVGIQ